MRKLFVLLGDPVAHSRSPAIHARAFALLGIDAAYAPCRVPAEDLERAVRFYGDVLGLVEVTRWGAERPRLNVSSATSPPASEPEHEPQR